MITEITDINNATGCYKWLPTLGLPALALAARGKLPGWGWMWVMALTLFIGAKWITIFPLLFSKARVSSHRLIAYFLLWPGMDASAFCTEKPATTPAIREWAFATVKTLVGVALIWSAVRLVAWVHPMVTGWVGMIGIVCLLHFGVFHLLSLVWRTLRVDARPIMHSPISARSLSAFWGAHWNRAFHDLMQKHLLVPLVKTLGMRRGLFAAFLVSGLLHELVISLPARGGYGLPTVYFALQGFGLLLERSRAGKRIGLGRGWRGRLFALVVAGGPALWLFHPPFIHHVILPMLRAVGAL